MGRKKGQRRRNPKPQLQDVPGSRTPSFSHESLEKTIDKEVAANNRPDPINSAERSVSESVHSSVSERSGAIDNVMSTLQSSQWIGNGSSQPPQPFHEAPPQPVLTSVPPPAVPFPPKSLPLSTPPPPFRQNQNPVNPPPFLCPSDSSYPPEANEYGFGEINVLHSMPQPSQTQFVSRTEGIHTRLGEEQQLSSVAVQQNQTPRQLEDHKNTLAGTEGNSPTAHFRPPDTTQRPPDTSQRPPDTSQRPPDTSHRPPDTTQRPPDTSQRPPDTSQRPPENYFSHPAQPITPPGFHPGLSAIHHSPPHAGLHLTSPQAGAQGTVWTPQMPPPPLPFWHAGPLVSQPCNPNNRQQGFSDFPGFPGMYPSLGPHQFTYGMQYPHPMCMIPAAGQQLRGGLQPIVGNVTEDTLDTSTGSENEEAPLPQTIKIRGVQDIIMATKCKYYFQNPNKGGGDMQEVKWDNVDHIYYIKFKDPKVAKRVVSSVHKLNGRQLEISFAPTGIPESVGLRTVEISGIDVEFLEVYQLYFENPTNGGGTVSKTWPDSQTQKLFITFEDAAVAEAVCSKEHVVEERVLQVKLANMEHLTGERSDVSELDEPTTALEVTVGQPLKNELFYRQYFETCRDGGSIKELILSEKDGKLLVTFDSVKVGQQVASGRHLIDGKDALVREVSFYSDKLLLRKVAQDVTKELLVNYVENVSGREGFELAYSDEPGDVVVSFDKKIDFSTIRDKCSAKPLSRRRVQVCRVPVSNCILVENFAPVLTNDEIALYFESSRADGGTVLKVQCAKEHSRYVFFEDPEVVQRVVMKKHMHAGRELRVMLFLECLGPSGGREDPYVFVAPEPLELSPIDNIKILFLQHCNAMLQVLIEHLSKVHAFGRLVEDRLKVECTLTVAIPNVHLLVTSWREDVNNQLETFLGSVSVDRQDVLPEIWPEVKKAVEDCETNKEDLLLTLEDEKSFVILGRNSFNGDTFKKIQTIVRDAEKEFSLKEQEVTETKKLKEHEFHLLRMSPFLSEAKKKYSRLKVDVRNNESEIIFHGLLLEIRDIQTQMLEMFLRAPSKVLTDMTRSKISILVSQNAQNTIGKKLESAGLAATWDCRSEDVVTVYCVKESDLHPAVQVIQGSLRDEDIPLDEVASQIIRTEKWATLKAKLIQDSNGFLIISTSANKIQITTLSDLLLSVKGAIKDFIVDNTVYCAGFRLSPSRQKFLSVFCEDTLTLIAEKLSQFKVNIVMDEPKGCVRVKGIGQGIERARKELEALDQKIVCGEEKVTRKEIIRYLVEMKSEFELEKIGKANQCVISLSPEENGVQIVFTNQPTKRIKKRENHPKVFAMLADITKLQVDVVVNAANDRMQHGAGVAGAILSKGGREIQEECYRILQNRGPLSEGDVLASGPGKLPCKAIIHAVGPRYKGGNKGEEKCLRATVLECLKTASDSHYTSIALPAISSGIFGYPVEEATRVIVEAVRFFFDTNTESRIRNVTLCDIAQSTVDLFQAALDRSSLGKESTVVNRDAHFPGLRNLTVYREPFSTLPEASRRIQIFVIEGEIAKVGSDAIVNSTSADLNLKAGAISSSILKAAGTDLQAECSDRYPKGIPPGEIACTGAYKLSCKAIFHVVLCRWDTKGAVEQLKLMVEKCLKEASNRQFSSVAIPPLGTGVLGFPREAAAQAILSTIDHFQKTSPNTSLKEITIVVFNDDKTLEAFCAEKRSKTQIGFEESTPLTVATELPEDPASNTKETAQVISEAGEVFPVVYRESMVESEIPFETVISWPGQERGYSSVTFDLAGLLLTIKQGDITEETADAIVNSSNSNLDLSRGAVSQALKAKCGEDLQRECNSKHKEIAQQTTAMTGGYNLKCKNILHINAEHYQSNGGWEKAYTVLLQTAEKSGLQSLAVPALGTGNFGLSPSDSAGALAKALAIHKQSVNSLKNLIVVLADSKTAKTFIDVLKGEANHDGDQKEVAKTSKVPDQSVPKKSIFQRLKGAIQHGFKTSKNRVPDVFKLYVFSTSEVKRQEFCKELYEFVDGKYENKEIKDLENLSPEEFEGIKEECISLNVELRRSPSGAVALIGMPSDVEKIREMIGNIVKETAQQNQETVTANIVQWYYFEEKKERKAFGKKENYRIEVAFQIFQTNRKEDSMETEDDSGNVFVINFTEMKKYPKLNASDCSRVMRKEIIQDGANSFSLLPETWEPHEAPEAVRLVDLPSGCDEYNSVHSNFSSTARGTPCILSIQRIQNPGVYKQYIAKKSQMGKQNNGVDSEKTLWHGTAPDVIRNINLNGFDRSFCGKNNFCFGRGTYFAVESGYSMDSKYSCADPSGKKYIYQCKVLVGHSTQGDRSMKILPIREGDVRYDSATNSVVNPQIYVIFHDAQAYPEYLITFMQM